VTRRGGRLGAIGLVACLLFACDGAPAASETKAATPTEVATPTATPAPAGAEGKTENELVAAKAPPVRKDGTIYGDGPLMGTHFSINVWLDPGRTPAEAGAAMQAAFEEIARIEQMMSEWIPSSELSRMNDASGGEPMALSPELFEVLARSREIAEHTGGAFDPTFYGVGQLWTFTPGSKPPPDAEIAARLELVDWRGIELFEDGKRGRLRKRGMKVGLGAIAKGYAVDRASQLLIKRGFANHVVEGGGDTYASGTKGGKPWMVGVQDPKTKGGAKPAVIGALPSSDISVVTSGDYERYFEYEGVRYAHILDPATGRPLLEAKSCKSITLVAPNATDADAYATAVAVMGPERGMEFVEREPGVEAILITRDDRVLVSSGLQSTFVRAPASPEPPRP
jgi:thiamine biosynthesis lipoprotein